MTSIRRISRGGLTSYFSARAVTSCVLILAFNPYTILGPHSMPFVAAASVPPLEAKTCLKPL